MGIKAEDDPYYLKMSNAKSKMVQRIESDLGSSDNSVRDALSEQFGSESQNDSDSNSNTNLN